MSVVLMSPLRGSLCTLPLVILLVFISYKVVWSQQQTLYVKTNSTSPCPDDVRVMHCQTLDWYSNNSNISFTSNTVMLFQEGIHVLDTFVEISSCHNFSLVGNGSALHHSDGQPHPTSTINCTGAHNGGLLFSNSSNIHIRNLELGFCSGSYTLQEKHDFAGSLVFSSVQDISLDQVVISNAKGYGLHTSNILGANEVLNSAFLNTSLHPNSNNSGNAMFFFSRDFPSVDTVLTVNSSWFMYGVTKGNYSTAGGLNVFVNCPNVHVTIVDVTTQGNVGTHGGNLALFLMVSTVNGSSIVMDDSRILDGKARKGGGMRLWSKHEVTGEGSFAHNHTHQILTISNTRFHNNRVNQTGGAMYIAFYNKKTVSSFDGILRQVVIRNCTFTENGGNGAAMEIIQHSLSDHRMTPMFRTLIETSVFKDNFMQSNVDGPILDFIDVEVSISNSIFTGSNTSVISLRNTYVNLYGNISFENNAAQVGAALKVCETSLVFAHIGTHVRFVNNSACKGGAIFVQQPCMDISPLCFVQPSVPENMPVSEFTQLMKLEFINNSATTAGDALYGGDLDLCSTVVPYFWNSNSRHTHYFFFKEIFKEIFDTQEQVEQTWISSNPRGVCFCHEAQHYGGHYNHSCRAERDLGEKYPGEEFTVSVITVGQMNGPTSGMIDASLVDEDRSHSLIRVSHPQMSAKCINLTYALNSNGSSAQISFTPVTPEIGTHYRIIVANLTIHLRKCPLGFHLTAAPPYKCVCSPQLAKYLTATSHILVSMVCNITKQTISIPQRRIWFGCYNSKQQQNKFSPCDSLAVTPNCDYYCRSTENTTDTFVEVSVTDIDSQCSPGQTGIMCGGCRHGYSRVLGGALGCQSNSHCSNINFPLILLGSLVSGVLIIAIIIGLNLTVTEGTLNGLLVYTVVIQTHRSYFPEDPSRYGQFCWTFISWINFKFGFKACLYKGMTGYQQIWFFFAQVFYFLLILALIVLLSRKFVFFTRLFGRNIIKVLATLALLLHSNILEASFITFRYATLHIYTSNGTRHSTKVAWYYDGNVPYFGLKHAPLFAVAFICSIVMLFFIFSLLLIQYLQKSSNLWCLHWVEKLRPFYEAFTGPCHDSYRFWPGFLIFMRSGIYIMNSAVPGYSDELFRIKMLVTAATFVVIISLGCIFPRGVYKRWPLNILEFSFYLNLCITSGILGFNYNQHQNLSVVYTSVSISALTFIGILVYHFHSQIKDTTVWQRLTARCSVQDKFLTRIQRKSRESEALESGDERASLLPHSMPPVVSFEDFREPLVEA